MLHPDPAAFATGPAPADRPAPARALIERQLVMLTRLAEIGMEIAEEAGRQATGAEPGAARDAGLAYARVARAVRLTLALQSRLLNDLAALDRGEVLDEAARAATRRRRLHRLVEQAIEAEHEGDEEETDRLSADAWEQLADEDDADITSRPLAEIVARICRDLGLSPEAAAWASEAAEPAAAGPAAGSHPRTDQPSTRPAPRPSASPAIVALNLTG